MKRKSWLLSLALLVVWSAPALAGKKAGVTMPDTVTVAGKQLVLNGMGVRQATILKVDVYVAGLYLEQKSSDGAAIAASQQTKRLDLKFKRKVDRSDITKAWRDGLKTNAGKDFAALQDRLGTVNGWMEDMREGDGMSFTYLPGKGIEVSVKGKRKGVVPGDDFARVFFSVWLGPKPPNKGLRSGLLGK